MFRFPLRVYYEDTDSGRVVYHSRYLNFMERARTELLREIGADIVDLQETHHASFVIKAMQINYLLPAKLNDQLVVISKINSVNRASMEINQEIYYHNASKNDYCAQCLVKALAHIACVNENMKPCALPEFLKKSLLELERET